MASQKDTVIGLHLDLKGMVHRPQYWPTFLRDVSQRGINTLLVEYEDMFPFKGIDIALDPRTRWSPALLEQFLNQAHALGLHVIPLQQCLGHLEYVLRWQRYRKFAEYPDKPATICLSHPGAKALVHEMLEQVCAAHRHSRWVHVGMDEAWRLASCPKCRKKGSALAQFVEHLHSLCDIVERHGKTPVLWSDMLEDHFDLKRVKPLKDRVILMPWDYSVRGKWEMHTRLSGRRVSRYWLDHADDPAAPVFGESTRFWEDLPAAQRKQLEGLTDGPRVRALAQVDLWTRAGFRVVGAAAVRAAAHGSVLPDFSALRDNVSTWADKVRDCGQLGVIATSWARASTLHKPNFPIELCWPLIDDLMRAMGKRPKGRSFWPGIDVREVRRLLTQLGRCKDDWRIEGPIAQRMAELMPKLCEHQYEWESLMLMARTLGLQHKAALAVTDVTSFAACHRTTQEQWQVRLDELARRLAELKALRAEVRRHFARRYHGRGFREWLATLFDFHVQQVRDAQLICRKEKRAAKKLFSGKK